MEGFIDYTYCFWGMKNIRDSTKATGEQKLFNFETRTYAIKRSFSEAEIWGDLPKATKPS
jgi:hypothetical protein